jgi:hypothetical protein
MLLSLHRTIVSPAMLGLKAGRGMLSCSVGKLMGKQTESRFHAEHNEALIGGWWREDFDKQEVDSQSDSA